MIISMDEEDDTFSETFFSKILSIPPKECKKNEFEVSVGSKNRFVFWKGPSMLLYDRSALDQYLLFHKFDVVFLIVSKNNQQVKIKTLFIGCDIIIFLLIGKDASAVSPSENVSF